MDLMLYYENLAAKDKWLNFSIYNQSENGEHAPSDYLTSQLRFMYIVLKIDISALIRNPK